MLNIRPLRGSERKQSAGRSPVYLGGSTREARQRRKGRTITTMGRRPRKPRESDADATTTPSAQPTRGRVRPSSPRPASTVVQYAAPQHPADSQSLPPRPRSLAGNRHARTSPKTGRSPHARRERRYATSAYGGQCKPPRAKERPLQCRKADTPGLVATVQSDGWSTLGPRSKQRGHVDSGAKPPDQPGTPGPRKAEAHSCPARWRGAHATGHAAA